MRFLVLELYCEFKSTDCILNLYFGLVLAVKVLHPKTRRLILLVEFPDHVNKRVFLKKKKKRSLTYYARRLKVRLRIGIYLQF